MKVKAMVVTEPKHMEIREFELPKTPRRSYPGEDHGPHPCVSSDIKVFKGLTAPRPLSRDHGARNRGRKSSSWDPRAAKYYDLKPGERITVEPYVPCGRCPEVHGAIFSITTAPHMGRLRHQSSPADKPPYLFGGYSEYFYVVPGAIVHNVPEKMPDSAASLSVRGGQRSAMGQDARQGPRLVNP